MADIRTRAGEQTRRRLLEAAATAFSRRGYHGTATAEIAAAAGVSEPTLFKHFGSKQALLVAALKQTASDLMAELDAPFDPAEDPFEAFVDIGKGGTDVKAMAEAIGRLMSLVLRIASPLTPLERATLSRVVTEARKRMQSGRPHEPRQWPAPP